MIRNEEHATAKENAGYRGSLCSVIAVTYNIIV
jgi:hypothetical protein